jgi:hypothetical protein
MPNLVTREELPLANALHQSTFASMLLIGSALGGIITQFFGRDDDVMMSVVTSASNVGVGLIASAVSPEAGAWAAVGAGLVGTLAWILAARKS